MKNTKKILSFVMAATMVLSSSAIPVSAEWYKTQSGKYYYTDSDGDKCIGWRTINGSKYYFDDSGYMKKGWFKDENGKYYYLRSDGRAAVDCTLKISGKAYSFDKNGVYVQKAAKAKKVWGMSLSEFKKAVDFDELEVTYDDDGDIYAGDVTLSGIVGKHGYIFENNKFTTEFYIFDYSYDNLKDIRSYFTKFFKAEPEYTTDGYFWETSSTDALLSYDSSYITVIMMKHTEAYTTNTANSGKSSSSSTSSSSSKTSSKTSSADTSSSQSRTVYITNTGKRYHYSSSCNGGKYYPSTLDEALRQGLTPCKKCT